METIQVDITRQYIYEYVTTLTGTIGRQKEAYDKYVCLPGNYPVLDRFMDTAIAVAEAALWRRVANTRNTTLQYSNGNLSITINRSVPERLQGALCTNLRLAIAYILTGMWLNTIEPELYAQYIKLADSYINNAAIISSQKDFSSVVYYTRDESDNVPSAAANFGSTGIPKREDNCINQHSRFDNAVFFSDGTVAMF